MGDVGDDIGTMFEWYHSDRLVGSFFRFYLRSFLNHSRFSLVPLNVAMQTIECWMKCWVLLYDLEVDNEQWSMHHTWRVFLFLGVHQVNLRWPLQFFEWISITTQASLRVSLGFPHWLGDSPRCSQTYHNRSHGAPIPVIRAPSSSQGRPECPPRVSFSPEIDASKFTLRLLSPTPGGSQWLKYILLMSLEYILLGMVVLVPTVCNGYCFWCWKKNIWNHVLNQYHLMYFIRELLFYLQSISNKTILCCLLGSAEAHLKLPILCSSNLSSPIDQNINCSSDCMNYLVLQLMGFCCLLFIYSGLRRFQHFLVSKNTFVLVKSLQCIWQYYEGYIGAILEANILSEFKWCLYCSHY